MVEKVDVKNGAVASSEKKSGPTVKLDLDKLIESSRKLYGKGEQGIASLITTSKSLPRPTEDKDFILWTQGNHWKSLCGVKGLPFGRFVQIAGKPDSGKSTHALCFMKEAQEQGCLVILLDSELKFSLPRFISMGGTEDNLVVINTNNTIVGAIAIANVVNTAKQMNPNIKIFLVVDSAGALLNPKEDQEDTEDLSSQPGLDAKAINFLCRKVAKLMHKYRDKETGQDCISILVVNQIYSLINNYGGGTTEKGGEQLKYLSSIILHLTRKKDLCKVKKGVSYKYGIVSRAKVKKNHLFDGAECVSELDLEVSAQGIKVYGEKTNNSSDEEIVEDNDD